MKNFLIILILFLVDQLTKNFVVDSIILNTSHKVSSFLNIIFIYNRGFLFGYFSDLPDLILLFIHLGLFFASIYIIFKFLFMDYKYRHIAILFFAGALGNSFDRFFREGVVDFLDFHFYEIHWPAFNFADSYIFIGVIIYIIKYVREEKICSQE